MSSSNTDVQTQKVKPIDKFLNGIEYVGNKLPDPAMIFLFSMLLIWVLSAIFSNYTFSAIDPRTGEAIVVNNLLTGDSLAAFLANMVKTQQEGRHLYSKLVKVTDRFLDVALQYVGSIPFDEAVKKSVQRQRAVLDAYPRAKASLAYKSLAQKADSWPLPSSPRGHLEFFVERLVQA